MVREIVRDAVRIKMTVPVEAPLISIYEYCYALGLGASIMKLPKEMTEELKNMDDFSTLKEKASSIIKASGDVWDSIENGQRLRSLLLGCRIHAKMDDDARWLFDLGYQE
ncbi:MAG: DUF3837 family protein [Muricoprocola sp.]